VSPAVSRSPSASSARPVRPTASPSRAPSPAVPSRKAEKHRDAIPPGLPGSGL
jgi:hypothetical protein